MKTIEFKGMCGMWTAQANGSRGFNSYFLESSSMELYYAMFDYENGLQFFERSALRAYCSDAQTDLDAALTNAFYLAHDQIIPLEKQKEMLATWRAKQRAL